MKPGTIIHDTTGIWCYIDQVYRVDPWRKRVGIQDGVRRKKHRWHRFCQVREIAPPLILRGSGRVLPALYERTGERRAMTRLEELVEG